MISKDKAHQSELNILDSSQVLVEDKNQIIEKLKQLLPDVINSDNQLNTQALQDVLDIANTTSNNQGYELTFAGKGIAKAKADEPTIKELKAELEQSKDFDNTENVVIRGDNIDTLKILKANYTNKIKMIYIDPPYNTKNENFVYNDNFKKSEAELIKEFGLAEETQNFLTNVYGTRSHSGWLSFMYPRLKIARELLKEDGVIFISIDDNEQANLKIMCDEIFGEENFEGHIHWRRRSNQPNDKTKMIGLVAEHILSYSKNSSHLKSTGVGKIALTGSFSNPDNDPNGAWASKPWKVGSDQNGSVYSITLPSGNLIEGEWMGDRNTYEKLISENKIYFSSENSLPRKKYYQKDRLEEGQCATNWWNHKLFGNNQEANSLMTELMNGKKNVFSNPKSTILITNLLNVGNVKNDIILDFFAGSGTTGDAVMKLNAEDGGKRKYILAQLDEPIDEKKEAYKFCKDNNFDPVISSITIERLNRAGEKIKADIQAEFDTENSKKKPNQEKLTELQEKLDNISKLDIGYKVFSLKDKPCLSEVTNDGGQVSFVPQNLRERTIDTLANMLCATCKPLHTKIETLIEDKLYKTDNEMYLLGNIDKSELNKYNDLKINVDGYSDLDLEHFLNLGVTDKDNVSVVY
ncbi:site-specific DNA-methyltransferase [Francisella adeliensis]|uniref:site-specific DNA-methyltransferase (adenine-specific) n=1 Tax=Francisella adeliensis TaxID=2007306 RepID=A0A2Z4XZQ8_9GAMM|nr:site-specific DNA-methyltransferase [Francisella adeliensis]AXA34156.1 site-specific DNA-methyltransferase [Francisella adeliensis]MBK2085535.1 site-specific DNA-methyltransferase [Francisella adeliensis]MBK2096343.1 site-specific DNA-methyltransferase [Francisella adeliensis]QIW12400.1 site-specific DNA-methyltransferase [Francisella adeliensis]QIW14274.1 site-specific DNA-methyltransferase [Francisella adeliensis]